MVKIVDGFKYDTESADLICKVSLNKTDVCSLYRGRKLKYYLHILEIKNASGEYEEKILPISKDDAMEFLGNHQKVHEYETLFGELPEAEGEDYVPNNAEILSDEKLSELTSTTVKQVCNNSIVPKSSLRQNLKLRKAVKNNDTAEAEQAIIKGAKLKNKYLSQAIMAGNLELVTLLTDFGIVASYTDLTNCILIEDTQMFKTILPSNLKRHEYVAIKRFAEKYNKFSFAEILEKQINQN